MITAYKYLEGFSGDAEEYERIRDEFWKAEVTEDSDNYILFKRFRVVPINLSNEEFWNWYDMSKLTPTAHYMPQTTLLKDLTTLLNR